MTDVAGWKGPIRTPPPGQLGPIVQKLRELQAAVRALQNAGSLRSASVSEGGLVIKDGGDLRIIDGGNVEVEDGGDVVVHAGGRFTAQWPDGSIATMFGPQYLDASPDVLESIGLLVQAANDDDNRDVFRAKTVLSTGSREVHVGQSDNAGNVDFFNVYSDSTFITGDDFLTLESDAQILVDAGTNLFLGADTEVFAKVQNITGSANMAVGGTPSTYGAVRRISSSRRYKQDIEPLDLSHLTADEIVDALQGVTWRDRGMVEDDPETTLRIPGHIAEDLHDAGLGAFVVYDDQDRPESISYDRLSGALAQALRTTRDELAAVRDELGDLRDVVATLTTRLDNLEA